MLVRNEFINVDRSARPLKWVAWFDTLILSALLLSPSSLISSLLRQDFEIFYGLLVFFLYLAFPGYIAWKNVNVTDSVTTKYTLTSLIYVVIPVSILALFVAAQMPSSDYGEPAYQEMFVGLILFTYLSIVALGAIQGLL
jgi:ABC-type uncharacterized transport system permease subunit